MAKSSAPAVIALGALGVAGWALMRSGLASGATPLGDTSAAAADAAGRGAGPMLTAPTQPARSATSEVVPASPEAVGYSQRWGRHVRPALAVGGIGTKVTAADSEGRHVVLTFRGLNAATESARWQSSAGVHEIPWDTSPLSYFWDAGKPHGEDPSAVKRISKAEWDAYTGKAPVYTNSQVAENLTGLRVPETPIWENPGQWFRGLFG